MFQAIINTSLRQRLLVIVASLLLIVLGMMSLRKMPVDVFPDLNKPTVTLMTEAGGMAPEEVEQLVSFPIESSMNGMAGVSRVRSVSGVGLSIVYVEFDWGTDIYRNRQQVAERLNLVREQLPSGVQPQMGPISSIMGEILLVALPIAPVAPISSAPEANMNDGHRQVAEEQKSAAMKAREFADWVMRPRLLNIPGVAQVTPIGGEVRQFRVELKPAQLQSLGLTTSQIEAVLQQFGGNTSGGFTEANGRELLIRHIGRSTRLEDLQNTVVAMKHDQAILLKQVADVKLAAAFKRGDGGYAGNAAVISSVQKQPTADSVKLTREVEKAIAELSKSMPQGVGQPQFLFRQADFIENSLDNVKDALCDGAIMVAVLLFLFLLNLRTTLISLIAIPLSLVVTILVFRYLGLSINTMTLGGLAIAIGELVDDAVVDVENVLRRLKENAQAAQPLSPLTVIAKASGEVRSGIVYATLIVVLVFVPLFALPGIEGSLFTPLGIAYVVSIFASMLVAMTVTPVLCYFLLPKMKQIHSGDSALVRRLKEWDTRLLQWSFAHAKVLLGTAAVAVVLATVSVAFFPRAFLPAFNEGTLTVNLVLNPGTSLEESNRLGRMAEQLIMQVPEVTQVGRRTGRAELDEHAEGVHYSEMDVDLKKSKRHRDEIIEDIRQRLKTLPASSNVGQPISHRLDHLLSGVRAQIALKIVGDDLDLLRNQAADLRQRLARVPGITDLQIEKQVLIPQIKINLDYDQVARYGLNAGELLRSLQQQIEGEKITQLVEGNRRFDLVLRLPESGRDLASLRELLIATPRGYVPLRLLANVEENEGPNQINRENSRRRIVLSANTDGRDMAKVIADIREELAAFKLPSGYSTSLEGQFQAQEKASNLIAVLAVVSLCLIFLVLYGRYRSTRLVLIIMGNIPLALVGSVIALWISGQSLSVAALVGFITLAGISTRNGILKISHYINLCLFEGEQFSQKMIVRGSLERLTPVLMTALVAAFALLPLLVSADAPGKEILHPVAVVIFGGLISSTILDTVLTPLMFWLWGESAVKDLLLAHQQSHVSGRGDQHELNQSF